MAARGKAVSGALDFLGLSSKKAAAYIDKGGKKATKYIGKGAKKVAQGRISTCCSSNEFSSCYKPCC
jgi:hypothetical protein